MTVSTVDAPRPPRLRSTTVVRRAVAADWVRLRSVRSTWWSLLAATGMLLFVGVAFGLEMDSPTPVWVAAEVGIVFVQFALLVPAMMAVTAEYSTGAIRTSLQAVPRRGLLALSRALVSVGVVTAAAVALSLAADLASGLALGSNAEVVVGDVVDSLAGIAALVASGAVITVGLGTVLRSSAGTLTTMFLLLLVLPVMLPNFGVGWLTTLAEHLPGSATMSLLEVFGEQSLSTPRAAAVLGVWVVAAAIAGSWSLLRRDAA